MEQIHIKERTACSECGRRLLNIKDGLCFDCITTKYRDLQILVRNKEFVITQQARTIATLLYDGEAQNDVFVALANERDYQDQKHGALDTYRHGPKRWLDIADERLTRAASAHDRQDYDNTRREALQAAAVIVAFLEQHGVVER